MRKSFTSPSPETVEAELDGPTPTETSHETGMITRPSMDLLTGHNQQFVGDIQLPWLQIAHGVGGLSKKGFSPGDLVLGGEALIYSPPRRGVTSDPLNLIILSYKQYWKEYLSKEAYEAKQHPKIFGTAKEAKDAGFTTEWTNGQAPGAPPAMTWLVLIKKPKDLMSHYFCISVGEDLYAPAYMSFDKAAYRSVKDAFGMAVNFTLRSSALHRALWEMTSGTFTAKSTGNESWVPRIKLASVLSEEQVKLILAAFVPPPLPENPDEQFED